MGSLFSPKTPTVQTTAPQELADEKQKVKKSRIALLETEGGIAGQELQPGQVQQRDTLLGN